MIKKIIYQNSKLALDNHFFIMITNQAHKSESKP